MSTFPYLDSWLRCLWHLVPPRGLIHIGAGGGRTREYPYLDAPRILAIEADIHHHARLKAQLNTHGHCQLVHALVADAPGPTSYYTLSQSNENGLCHANDLKVLWPNIKTVRTEASEATTLKSLMDLIPDGSTAFNWAVIDCLPAGEVLRGANELPETWDVVVVRATKEALIAVEQITRSLSLSELNPQLSQLGLDFVAMEEENHPHMVRALFVRKPAPKLEQIVAKLRADYDDLLQMRDTLIQQRDKEIQGRIDAVLQRDEQRKLARELQTALIASQAQHDSLANENSRLLAETSDLALARDKLAQRLEAEVKAKLEVTSQRDEQCKLANELQVSLTARDHDISSKQRYIEQLEIANHENAARQQLMQEEIARAEAQIELIKELLLREPGL